MARQFVVEGGWLHEYVKKWPESNRAIVALSKKKWGTLVKYLEENDGVPFDGSTSTCACCNKYFPECVECPVRKYTGKRLCEGTPYVRYHQAYEKYRQAATSRAEKYWHDEALKAAKAEVELMDSIMSISLKRE